MLCETFSVPLRQLTFHSVTRSASLPSWARNSLSSAVAARVQCWRGTGFPSNGSLAADGRRGSRALPESSSCKAGRGRSVARTSWRPLLKSRCSLAMTGCGPGERFRCGACSGQRVPHGTRRTRGRSVSDVECRRRRWQHERLVALPDNPCDLLTQQRMASITRLAVTAVHRVPSIAKAVEAEREYRQPDAGTICNYETDSAFAAITGVRATSIPTAQRRLIGRVD